MMNDDAITPIVEDIGNQSSNGRLESAMNHDLDGRASSVILQERFPRTAEPPSSIQRNLLCGISEEEQELDKQCTADIVEDNELLQIDRLDDNECYNRTSPPPIPVKKTRSGVSSSRASTKPSLLDNPKISTIRQHYYPEGGWGWIICLCGLVINMMTTGLLLSYGVLYEEVLKEFGEEYSMKAIWLGSLSLSTGLFLSPLIVAFCRRKSTRLTAVFGGLTSALGCLFTSFASQMHQVFFSYGFVFALGLGVARETATLMTGQYFKRRREWVEIVVQTGTGIGVGVFSFVLRKIVRVLGWRLGLHAVTGIAVIPFFVGICYRSASLYHPQRRAILHLKNQRKKIKDKSGVSDKPPFFDFTPLSSGTLIVTMVSAALCSFGLYAPFFYFVPIAQAEGLEEESILLVQLHIGSAFSVGCLIFGLLVVKRNPECMIAKHYLCQVAMLGVGISLLALCAVHGYHGYVLFAWMYGVFCGGYHYALKMLVFDSIRARSFSRAWGYVEWAKSVPVLVGIPVTGYINESQGTKTGFFFSAGCVFAGAAALMLHNVYRYSSASTRRGQGSCSTCTSQAPSEIRTQELVLDAGVCTCTNNSLHSNNSASIPVPGTHQKCQRTISFASTVNVAEDSPKRPELLTCVSEEGLSNYKLRNDWCDNEECLNSCQNRDKYMINDDFETNPRYSDDICRVPLNNKQSEYDCGHTDSYAEAMSIHVAKRPMTVIDEVTSTV